MAGARLGWVKFVAVEFQLIAVIRWGPFPVLSVREAVPSGHGYKKRIRYVPAVSKKVKRCGAGYAYQTKSNNTNVGVLESFFEFYQLDG
jgi:hypothetical protein